MENSDKKDSIDHPISTLISKLETFGRQHYKIVVGIISCLKNQNKIETIRQTWVKTLKKRNIDYFFVISDSDITQPQVKGDILFVPTNDHYENLPEKVALLYEYIYDNTSYDYVFKVDDDCYLNADNLYKTNFWKYDYLGTEVGFDATCLLSDWHFGKCDDPKLNATHYWKKHQGSWCGGGYGYFLSRKAMKIIKDNKREVIDDLYEDKAVGDTLRKNNILPNNNEFYTTLNPFAYNIDVNDIEQFKSLLYNIISKKLFDYCVIMEIRKRETMYHIHEIFLNPALLKQKNSMQGLENILKEKEVKIKFLNEEIIRQKTAIQWYKDTYENRKLSGIIKSKLLKPRK